MKKVFNKSVMKFASLILAGSIVTSSTANAALILAYYPGSLLLLIIGAVTGNMALVILDENGAVSQDGVATQLMLKYPGLEQQAARDLSSVVAQKFSATAPVNGRVEMHFTRAELSQALEASQVEFNQPELFSKMVKDLQ